MTTAHDPITPDPISPHTTSLDGFDDLAPEAGDAADVIGGNGLTQQEILLKDPFQIGPTLDPTLFTAPPAAPVRQSAPTRARASAFRPRR